MPSKGGLGRSNPRERGQRVIVMVKRKQWSLRLLIEDLQMMYWTYSLQIWSKDSVLKYIACLVHVQCIPATTILLVVCENT